MRSLTINAESAKEEKKEGLPVKAGQRTFWASDVKYTTSRAGNEMLVITWVCVEDLLTDGIETGQEVKDYFVLDQNNVWKLNKIAYCMGHVGDVDVYDKTGQYQSVVMEDLFFKKPVTLDVKVRKYKYMGEDREKPEVKGYIRWDGKDDMQMNSIMIRAEKRIEMRKKWENNGSSNPPSSSYSQSSSDNFNGEVPF